MHGGSLRRSMQRLLKHLVLTGLTTGLLIVLCLFPRAAYATTYGSSAYGSCGYQTCTTVTTPTVQVVINLVDGQTVPASGYTIVVTPLDGTGGALSTVQFFINGSLVNTQAPGSDGTVRWTWQPKHVTVADVHVLIFGKDGATSSRDFRVKVVSNVIAAPQPAPSLLQAIVGAPAKLVQSAEQGIRTLPNVVKYSLPYFLFIFLAADILFLLYHARREISASRQLEALIKQEREMGGLKKTFTSLISHYLRTPLSIVKGGVDLLVSLNKVASPAIANLQADTKVLGDKIDQLIAQGMADTDVSSQAIPAGDSQAISAWRQPILLIPVIVIGVVAFSFDYLAQHAGSFDQKQGNLIIQIIVFGSSAVVLYVVARQLLLHRRNNAVAKQLLDEEVRFNQSRDEFITTSAIELNGLVGTLEKHVAESGQTPAKKFLDQGAKQLHDVITKFDVASQLHGSSSDAPQTSMNLSTLCTPVIQNLSEKAATKHVTVKVMNDALFRLQSPELLSLVVQTILDNAIDYSPENGTVEVSAQEVGSELKVAITDHGQGIPADKQYALFQAFAKLEGAEVFNREGMGFSLYLDRLIMFYLHGDIAVSAVKPQGTKVTLTLPSAVTAG